MKKIALLLLTPIIPILLLAQTPLSISESTVKYEKSEYPCVEVVLQPEAKEVKKAWEDFLKDEYDVNLKGIGFLANKDVLTAEQTSFPELSEKEMDFYTKVVEKKGQTHMSVFATLGYDIYLAPRGDYAKGFREMEDIVRQFLTRYLPEYYRNTIEELDETVADLQKERSDMEETIVENREQIKELEKQIKDLQKDNQDLQKDLRDKVKTLEETTNRLETRRSDFAEVKQQLDIKENDSSR